jgi:hypothetical protein
MKPLRIGSLAFKLALPFFVLTTSGYTLSTLSNSFYYELLVIPSFILILYLYAKNGAVFYRFQISTAVLMFFLGTAVISFISNYNVNYLLSTLKYSLTILFSYLVSQAIDYDKCVKYFRYSLLAIVSVSLGMYGLVNILGIIPNMELVVNANGVGYYNGYLVFLFTTFGLDRNMGCFWEPGIFATYITVGMILELMAREKINVFVFILYLIAMYTTKSTAGYFNLLLILYLYISNNIKGIAGKLGYLSLLGATLFAYTNLNMITNYFYFLMPKVFGKIIYYTASVSERIDSPLTNLSIFYDHLIVGAGIGKTETLYNWAISIPQTSTSTYYLAAFGILGAAYTLFWVYGVFRIRGVLISTKLTLIVLIIVMLNKEPHTFFTASYIILFFLLKSNSQTSIKT